jgi:broad specificity phosphatase PhoE
MIKVITKIAEANPDKNVLVFSHATSIKSFAGYCLGKGLKGLQEVPWAGNASTTEIEYKDGKFTLIDYGRNDYLGQISTVLPDKI